MLGRWTSRSRPPGSGPDGALVPGQTIAADELGALEEAPIIVLIVSERLHVEAANERARAFFGFSPARLPASLVELSREARLEQALAAGETSFELRLVHHHRTVQVDVVAGPGEGRRTVFISDVTQLRRLETVRQEFVANLSHELKTPVTSLRLAAESLLPDPAIEARRTFVNRLVREADHLVAIVDNLRQLAEIETGRVDLSYDTFSLEGLLVEVTDRIQPDRSVRLDIPDGLMVTADRAKLAQTLGNLLDNAAKFSPPGSPIEVEGLKQDAELVVRVRDHGPGISPEHWDRVFERFYKVDPARSREVPGSGLGLAIAKHLVLMHRGRVWTEAARDGGQVFALAIPEPAEESLSRPITSP